MDLSFMLNPQNRQKYDLSDKTKNALMLKALEQYRCTSRDLDDRTLKLLMNISIDLAPFKDIAETKLNQYYLGVSNRRDDVDDDSNDMEDDESSYYEEDMYSDISFDANYTSGSINGEKIVKRNFQNLINESAWICVYLADLLYAKTDKKDVYTQCVKQFLKDRLANQCEDTASSFYGCNSSCLRCDVACLRYHMRLKKLISS